jgi:hypothetical protein
MVISSGDSAPSSRSSSGRSDSSRHLRASGGRYQICAEVVFAEDDAWHDDDGNAEHLLHAQLLDEPPRRRPSTG